MKSYTTSNNGYGEVLTVSAVRMSMKDKMILEDAIKAANKFRMNTKLTYVGTEELLR